jgi:hypothetical protein
MGDICKNRGGASESVLESGNSPEIFSRNK